MRKSVFLRVSGTGREAYVPDRWGVSRVLPMRELWCLVMCECGKCGSGCSGMDESVEEGTAGVE